MGTKAYVMTDKEVTELVLITCDSDVCEYCARRMYPRSVDDEYLCNDCFNHNFFIGIECWRENE